MSVITILRILIGFSLSLGTLSAWALPSDYEQAIRFNSKESHVDDKQGITTFKGDVVVIQGSIKITGDTVTMTRNPGGEVNVITAIGDRAYFEQLQKIGDPKPLQAYAITIQYNALKNQILLIDKAKVINQDNTIEGEKIVYDTIKQVAIAGQGNSANITAPRSRVEMVLYPKRKSTPENVK